MRFDASLTGIGNVTVNKGALITTLKENKARHYNNYVAALVVFRERVGHKLDALKASIMAGGVPKYLSVNLPVPEEHSEDYDRAIRMLEMHTGDTVELSEQAYMKLVADEWDWRDAWRNNTMSYVVANTED